MKGKIDRKVLAQLGAGRESHSMQQRKMQQMQRLHGVGIERGTACCGACHAPRLIVFGMSRAWDCMGFQSSIFTRILSQAAVFQPRMKFRSRNSGFVRAVCATRREDGERDRAAVLRPVRSGSLLAL